MNSLAEELRGHYAYPRITPVEPKKRPELTVKKQRHEEWFYRLFKCGFSPERIAQKTGFHIKTVQRYLKARRDRVPKPRHLSTSTKDLQHAPGR
jgi:hypothetical protein